MSAISREKLCYHNTEEKAVCCMKKGLVLEGGAMRGMFTAGVLDIMMENGIVPDGCAGVSAGACFGCNIKSHQIGRAIRYNLRFSKDWRYCSVLSWLKTGDLYGGEYDYQILPKKLDYWDVDTFAKSPMEFYAVATNVKNGHPLYHKCSDGGESDLAWIQGSASMPIASRPVKADGFTLLDGGISDSIPLHFMEGIGYDRCIVVLTQPRDYVKKPYSENKLKIFKRGLQRYPAVYEKLVTRHDDYNHEIEEIKEQERKGEILAIRPHAALHISSICHDPKEKKRVYEEGRQAGQEALAQMKEFWEVQ
jgi:predicted patatin/cPLA2 family phospholipase